MIKAVRVEAKHSAGTSILEIVPQTAAQLELIDIIDYPVALAQDDWINLYDWVEKQAKRGAPFVRSKKNQRGKKYAGNKEGIAHWICGMFGLQSEYHNYPREGKTYLGITIPEIGQKNCATNFETQSTVILVKPVALLEAFEAARERGRFEKGEHANFWLDVRSDLDSCARHNPAKLRCVIGVYPDDVAAVQNGVMRIYARTDGTSFVPHPATRLRGNPDRHTP